MTRGDIDISGLADHVMKNRDLMWNEVKIVDLEQNYRTQTLEKAAYRLGHNNLLSRHSAVMSSMWEQVISKDT